MEASDVQQGEQQEEQLPHRPARDLGERLRSAVDAETEEEEADDSEESEAGTSPDEAGNASASGQEETAAEGQAESPPDPAMWQEWPVCPYCAGRGHVPPELSQAPTYEACPDCHGLGQYATGSLTSDGAVIQCERCMGNGYVRREVPIEGAAPPPEPWQQRY